MGKFSKQHLLKFFETDAGENALRKASQIVSKEIIAAAKYYTGVPDGTYFTAKDFEENAVKTGKAYITLNSIMGGETAEEDRFHEGKKQVPELITKKGIQKMIQLITHLYCFASGNTEEVEFSTVRACRQSEIAEGESIVGPLSSTTKLTIDEIMDLGYGDKNALAICIYHFHRGSVIFDMEKLGKEYPKPEEREVLLLTGNRLKSECLGYDQNYVGKDGNPALIYKVDVYHPKFEEISETKEELEKIVYHQDSIDEIRAFFTELNEADEFPSIPECYPKWKEAFKKLVYIELEKLS